MKNINSVNYISFEKKFFMILKIPGPQIKRPVKIRKKKRNKERLKTKQFMSSLFSTLT